MFQMMPIGFVRGGRSSLRDDFWGDVTASIELRPEIPSESLIGLGAFSHVEVIFVFDRDAADQPIEWIRRPRGDSRWPIVGVFAQRGRRRPNRLGATIVRVIGLRNRGIDIIGLDALEGTPVLDIKPVIAQFLPREPVGQPTWATELMVDYWKPEHERRE
jgi:tRNA (Thr-GGU) A37 N-methylase